MLSAVNSFADSISDLEKHLKDGRLTEPSDGKLFDYKKMYEAVKRLNRPLTEEEAEVYRIK